MRNGNIPILHPRPTKPRGAAETPGLVLVDVEGPHHPLLGGELQPRQRQTLLGRKAQCGARRSLAQLANKWLFCEGLLLMCFKWLSEWKM